MKLRGCFWKPGVNGLGVWGVRWLPCRERFDTPARLHDRMYDKGGTGWNRAFYDVMFGQFCWKYARNGWERMLAVTYYIAVRVFGWMFFRYER